MSRRAPDHVKAAIEECRVLGASFTWSVCPHNIVGVIEYNGKTRKLFMSKTPSDFRAPQNVKKNVRQYIREMM